MSFIFWRLFGAIVAYVFRCVASGWIGSIIINHSSLKPAGYTSRTVVAYILLTSITFGIFGLVASICNLFFDPAKAKNLGYKKD